MCCYNKKLNQHPRRMNRILEALAARQPLLLIRHVKQGRGDSVQSSDFKKDGVGSFQILYQSLARDE
jgi:hypothetical protein